MASYLQAFCRPGGDRPRGLGGACHRGIDGQRRGRCYFMGAGDTREIADHPGARPAIQGLGIAPLAHRKKGGRAYPDERFHSDNGAGRSVVWLVGEMSAQMTISPASFIRCANSAASRMFPLRPNGDESRSRFRCWRRSSPSKSSQARPCATSCRSNSAAFFDLPAPESPVS